MTRFDDLFYLFESSLKKLRNEGVNETDLPFLNYSSENKTGIILIHGSQATPCNTIELGKILFEKGYNTIGVLLEGHGVDNSPLNEGQVTWKDCYNSVLEYFNFFKELNDEIFILGSSFGGSLTYLLAIELEKFLSGIIAISAPTHSKREKSYGENWAKEIFYTIKTVENNINQVNVPTLILHSNDDNVVKVNQALFAFDNIFTAQKKMIIYDRVGHSLGFGSNTVEVANDINNFIITYKSEVTVRFELFFQNAETVHLAGDFNNWSSQKNPMSYEKGKWFLDLSLLPGKYQYKFVINGQNWILDPNAEKVFTPGGKINSLKIINPI